MSATCARLSWQSLPALVLVLSPLMSVVEAEAVVVTVETAHGFEYITFSFPHLLDFVNLFTIFPYRRTLWELISNTSGIQNNWVANVADAAVPSLTGAEWR